MFKNEKNRYKIEATFFRFIKDQINDNFKKKQKTGEIDHILARSFYLGSNETFCLNNC